VKMQTFFRSTKRGSTILIALVSVACVCFFLSYNWRFKKDSRLYYPIEYNFRESSIDLLSDLDYEKTLVFNKPNKQETPNLSQQKLFYQRPMQLIRQKKEGQESASLNLLQTLYIPQVSCPTQVRVGPIGLGGYTMCNPWKATEASGACIVYSFGVQNYIPFEQELYDITGRGCEIYCFDEHVESLDIFKPFNGRFMKATISATTDVSESRYSILDLTRKFNHNKIEILKVDIEGAEFSALPAFLRSFNSTVCHIVMELHGNGDQDAELWLRLFRMLERRGYRLYDREVNTYSYPVFLFQYSYIHLNCFEKYGLDRNQVFFKFF